MASHLSLAFQANRVVVPEALSAIEQIECSYEVLRKTTGRTLEVPADNV